MKLPWEDGTNYSCVCGGVHAGKAVHMYAAWRTNSDLHFTNRATSQPH